MSERDSLVDRKVGGRWPAYAGSVNENAPGQRLAVTVFGSNVVPRCTAKQATSIGHRQGDVYPPQSLVGCVAAGPFRVLCVHVHSQFNTHMVHSNLSQRDEYIAPATWAHLTCFTRAVDQYRLEPHR